MEAVEVFTEHFIQCVTEHGWYRDSDIPDEFLEAPVVMGALQKHLKYAFQIYRRASMPKSLDKTRKAKERKSRASRTTRKGWVIII